MSLQNLCLEEEYRNKHGGVVRQFLIPLLKEGKTYKRAVGFFSSSALVQLSEGLESLVRREGTIRLIASPKLSENDYNAIRMGYAKKEELILGALRRELREPINSFEQEQLNLLANLIADGILEIRIALLENETLIGMYHEKLGVVEDDDGNIVAFSGSMNESENAMVQNYETIDVFCSWTKDRSRAEKKKKAFDDIWFGHDKSIRIIHEKEIDDEFVRRYKKREVDYASYKSPIEQYTFTEDIDYVNDNWEQFGSNDGSGFFSVPDEVDFYQYQKDAIEEWASRSYCGIYDMATGTGKTYTALGSLSRLSKDLNDHIAVVIVAPYQHLVEQWVEDIEKFNVKPIVAYSYQGQKWQKQFADAVEAYNSGVIKNFCIISTNATFATEKFQLIIKRFRRNYCFVVDEAHNFGATKLSTLLPKKARYRLALSATIERYRDEQGTEALKQYFGGTPCISFSLKQAIEGHFLTPYYYYPIRVNLNEEELEDYKELTNKIVKAMRNKKDNEDDPYLDMLLIKRARIVAGCRNKIDKLMEIISKYKHDNHMLVYCGATKYDNDYLSDEKEIKQIDEVSKRLYKEHGIIVRKFTSMESKQEREEIKELFAEGSVLQAVTAIKCLDEGMNIPAIQKAFILASSTNPKEYIQRRGRVLRKADGKEYAEIFDFITIPRPLDEVSVCSPQELEYDKGLINREFERMREFADCALNPAAIDQEMEEIKHAYKVSTFSGGMYYE